MAGAEPLLTLDGVVATITLRRPSVANRLELSDLDTLLAQVGEVDANETLRVLVLRAEGRHFCSGFNVGQVGGAGGAASDRFEALAGAIETARPLTVAALQGSAYGGAVDLSVACDFRLAAEGIEMMVPASKLGLHFYRGGLERMVARLGLVAAKRVLVAAERLDTAALHRLGIVDRVSAPDAFAAEVGAFVQQLAALAPLAALPMKQHLNAIARGALDAQAVATDIARALASDDLREGGLAWAEKRAPRFTGR
jgi:enoyl-CoA hydratase/carnithine racemase